MDNRAASVFGTVDFEVTDRLTLNAGFNYTDDQKDYALNMTAFDELANINFVDAVIAGQIAGALMIPPSQVTPTVIRSEEHTSELQSLMRISYAVFCLKKNNKKIKKYTQINYT